MVTTPGTLAPPATLGGYDMFAFPIDSRPESGPPDYIQTNYAPFWESATLDFSEDVDIKRTPGSWATWSHGYSGTVYAADFFVTEITLTFPTDMKAFYMYVQPNLFSVFEFEFVSDGAGETLMIDGNGGARYVGVYTDDPLGSLGSLTITQVDGLADGFAFGEFGSNIPGQSSVIPEPAQAAGVGLLLLSGLLLRHRRAIAR
jgi:hypothetical protein